MKDNLHKVGQGPIDKATAELKEMEIDCVKDTESRSMVLTRQ